jgi:hypothetical protein
LTAAEANFALQQAGLLKGEPSSWSLTDKGKEHATETRHWNGVNGAAQYVVDYDVRTWDDRVLDVLDFDDDKRREAQRAAADSRREAREARREQEVTTIDAPGDGTGSPDVNVALLVVAGLAVAGAAAYGMFKLAPRLRRRRGERPSRAEDSGT